MEDLPGILFTENPVNPISAPYSPQESSSQISSALVAKKQFSRLTQGSKSPIRSPETTNVKTFRVEGAGGAQGKTKVSSNQMGPPSQFANSSDKNANLVFSSFISRHSNDQNKNVANMVVNVNRRK